VADSAPSVAEVVLAVVALAVEQDKAYIA